MTGIDKIVELAVTSDWWQKQSESRRRAYLKRHPNSKFKPGNHALKKAQAPKTPSPAAPAPKKERPTTVSTPKIGAPSKEKSKKAKQVKKNWSTSDDVKSLDDKLKTPKSWGKRKVRKAASAIRGALTSKTAKKMMMATAKVLVYAGATVALGGAGLALGADTSVFLPALLHKAWDDIKDTNNDLELVNAFTRRMRQRLENPSEEELNAALHEKK